MIDQHQSYNNIVESLYNKNYLDDSDLSSTSDYWQRKGLNADYSISLVNNKYIISGEHFQLGSYKKQTLKNVIEHIPVTIQLTYMLKKINCSKNILGLGKNIVKERKIIFGYDHVKQLLCIDTIYKLKLFENLNIICVIGDGYGFVTTLIKRMYPDKTVICVNIGRMLIFDVLGCEQNLFSQSGSNKVSIIKKTSDLENYDKGHLFFLEAENCGLLRNLPIGLFINICSMQEMEMDVINNYFSIMRSSSIESYFYCCNRQKKTFKDGSCISFEKYPWIDNDEILLDDICPWIASKPVVQFPFVKYFQPHQHRAVKIMQN